MKVSEFMSEIDSERFGFKVAKINEFKYPLEDVLSFLEKNNFKLIITKVNLSEVDLINQLEKNGFLLKDSQITLRLKRNDNQSKIFNSNEIYIRKASLKDANDLKFIAENSFNEYGHYAKNELINPMLVPEIYSDWIDRSLLNADLADEIFVAEIKNKVVGFLSLKMDKKEQCRFAKGGIGAVLDSYRNRHVFRSLIGESINWASKQNLDWTEHNVLTTNYPVSKAFLALGFSISNSFITMHKSYEH